MKIIDNTSMRKICMRLHPELKFEKAIVAIIESDDWKKVVPTKSNKHYTVREDLLKYLY